MFEGIIVAWSVGHSDIPLGWHLCDGSGNTPDLRDIFIANDQDKKSPEYKIVYIQKTY